MSIRLELVSLERKDLLRHLLADYLAELAHYGEVDPDYRYFDDYWDRPAFRWPHLFHHAGEVVGFALVNQWSPSGIGTDFAMAEFYIVPGARGHGLGRAAANAVFAAHAGQWELMIFRRNEPAQRFWPKALAEAGAAAVERIYGDADGETVYRFVINDRAPGTGATEHG